MNQENQTTDITIVLDRSGSMAATVNDVIHGYNHLLADQKKAPGRANITLHQFDTVFETPIPTSDVQKAQPLTDKTFVPRGGTALLDAVARGIVDTGVRLSANPAVKVIFVIITDGEENSSKEFDRAKVMEMINHQRDKYSWEFVFLGANQDAIQGAASIGIHAANAMTYAHNSAGTRSAFEAVGENLVAMRCGSKKDMSYETKQRDDQMKAGAKTK